MSYNRHHFLMVAKHFARKGYATDGAVDGGDIGNLADVQRMDTGAGNIQNKIGGLNQFLSGFDLEAKTPKFHTGLDQPQIGGASMPSRYIPPNNAKRTENLNNFYGNTPENIKNANWYHWSPKSFDEFKTTRSDQPFHFVSQDPEAFAEMSGMIKKAGTNEYTGVWPEKSPQLYPLHVRAENPFDYKNPDHVKNVFNKTDPSKIVRTYLDESGSVTKPIKTSSEGLMASLRSGDWSMIEHPEVQRAIRESGHDSFYVDEKGRRNLAVFDPNQLKSRIGNLGTFDLNNNKITESRGGSVRHKYATDGFVDDDQTPINMSQADIDAAVSKLPGATISPTQPTIRDTLASGMLGEQPTGPQRQFVRGLLGSEGAGKSSFGLSDLLPVDPLSAQENYQKGNYQNALLNLVPMRGPAALEGEASTLARSVMPRPVIPTSPNLSAPEKTIESRLATKIAGDPHASMHEYSKLTDEAGQNLTANGRILNTDTARELSPDYSKDMESKATLSPAVHEPSSWLTKWMYEQKLAQPPKANEDPMVLFTAGGAGAGKSTALRDVPAMSDLEKNAQIIYDTNMNNYGSSKKKIDQALDAGRQAVIAYVYRDPVDALVNGSLPRAMRMGRTVPLDQHFETHAGSADTIRRLATEYADNPNVAFRVIDNSRGRGNATLGSLETIDPSRYNNGMDRLRSALDKAYADGKISEPVYRGTLGSNASGQSSGGFIVPSRYKSGGAVKGNASESQGRHSYVRPSKQTTASHKVTGLGMGSKPVQPNALLHKEKDPSKVGLISQKTNDVAGDLPKTGTIEWHKPVAAQNDVVQNAIRHRLSDFDIQEKKSRATGGRLNNPMVDRALEILPKSGSPLHEAVSFAKQQQPGRRS